MKTIKVSDLTGAALDWAVAKCEGVPEYILNKPHRATELIEPYSTNWAQGGPIIERAGVYLWRPYGVNGAWSAKLDSWQPDRVMHDDKPLIAAMRCYVASKLGDTVEVPKELAT